MLCLYIRVSVTATCGAYIRVCVSSATQHLWTHAALPPSILFNHTHHNSTHRLSFPFPFTHTHETGYKFAECSRFAQAFDLSSPQWVAFYASGQQGLLRREIIKVSRWWGLMAGWRDRWMCCEYVRAGGR